MTTIRRRKKQEPGEVNDSPDKPVGSLAFEGSTGYLLARTGAVARSHWARMLAERGLTPHHYGMLMALEEQGPVGQQRLSELVGIDPRNAVPVIDGLTERGLVVREVHPTDRRRRVLALTSSGHDTVRDMSRTGAEIERHFLRALTPADQAELHRMLLTLLASADDEHAQARTRRNQH
jgi:DNA-binding MarR family transcriptional regulator